MSAGFLLVLIPSYWGHYGPANLLWFSNVALGLVVVGICLESPLLVSMAGVGVLLPEMGWAADFLVRLATGRQAWGLTEYLWTGPQPLWVRLLTLYHLLLVPGLWWLIGRLGYDRRALGAWWGLAWPVLLLAYVTTDPQVNINRVFGFGAQPQTSLPPGLYLLLWMALLPLLCWWPTHRLLLAFRPGRREPQIDTDSSPRLTRSE